MRPPRGGGSFRGARRRGSRGDRGGRGVGHGSFGGRGGDGSCDEGPPSEVVEISSFVHACKGEAVTKLTKLTQEKIPCFNAPIYLQNKIQIGKVEEIFGPINESFFSIKMIEGMVATSYAPGDKFYIDPAKLLPLARFLPQPKMATDDIAQLGALVLEGEGAKPLTLDEVFTIDPRTMRKKLREAKGRLKHLPVRGAQNCYFSESKKWYVYCAHKGDRRLRRSTLAIMSALIVHMLSRIRKTAAKKLFGLHTIRYFYYLLKNTPDLQTYKITMRKVSECIDDMCCHFQCNRRSLGVTSSDCGSVYVGHIIVVRRDFDSCEDVEENASRLNQPYRINFFNVQSIKIAKVAPKFILIVEKMSVFEELLAYRFHQKFPSVVITGAGQASLDCRAFVKMVSDSLNVPVLMLADNNSFGFEIFKTLKYGSLNMAFMAKNLVVPSIRFIGLLRSDLEEYNISDSDMILASEKEISKAREMKIEDWIRYEPAISKDLDFFLEHKKSADIELLSLKNGTGFLVESYLRRKIEEIVHLDL